MMAIRWPNLALLRGRSLRVQRNGAVSLADTLLTILTYFLLMRQVVLNLGLAQAGLWSLILGYLAFLRILDQGGAASVSRFVASAAQDGDRQAGFADSAAAFSFAFFITLGTIAFAPIDTVLRSSVDAALVSEASQLLVGLLLVLPVQMVALGQLAVLDGIGRADLRGMINVTTTIIYACLAYWLLPDHGLMALVYGQAVQFGLAALAARGTLVVTCPSIRLLPLRTSLTYIRPLVGFGARLQFATIPMSLFDAANRILIARFAGLASLGLYDLAYKFSASARLLVQAPLQPLMPEFARLLASDAAAARHHFATLAPIAIIVAAGVSVAQIIAIPLASYMLLGRIDVAFLVIATCLSLAWGVANIGLTSQMYARAAGILRWTLLGQWLLLGSGIALMFLADGTLGGIWILVAPAVAIAFGHSITFAGEARQFGLNPLRSKRGPLALASLAIVALAAGAMIAVAASPWMR
jgi:O-antigen/teichoic acid export membrane protein